MLKVLLVRHAQCEMNLVVNERIGGRTNHSPLTPLGEQQARALGAHLRAVLQRDGIPPQRVQFHSSTAVRALETARIVMEAVQASPAALARSEQLLELEQGQWEGAVRRECFTPELTARFAADPWGLAWTFAPPGGESQREVEERMAAYLKQVVLPGLSPGVPAVVVSHGMAMKCLLRHLLGSLPTMSRNIAWNNTGCTEVGFVPAPGAADGSGAGTWHILRVNDASHLPHELLS